MNIMIKVLIIVITTLIIIKINDFIFTKMVKGNQKIHVVFMQGIIKAIITIIGIVVLGMQFEFTKDWSSALIKNTALLVAVLGFAAQQTLNDILSGLMLSWYRPFNIGERIHLVNKDITGIVEDITLRHTVIRCFDNNRIIIPNSIINKEILKNSNYQDSVIGNYLEIGISLQSDVHLAIELLEQIIRTHPSVMTTDTYQPGILVKGISQNGFLLKATVWTKSVNENFQACSDIRILIKEEFIKQDIQIL